MGHFATLARLVFKGVISTVSAHLACKHDLEPHEVFLLLGQIALVVEKFVNFDQLLDHGIRFVPNFNVLHLHDDLLLLNGVAGWLLLLKIALGFRTALWLPVLFLLFVLHLVTITCCCFSVELAWFIVLL